MGIIRKQSIQGSFFLYLGIFVGFITTAILFPRMLKAEQIGLVNTLVSYSTVFAQFATLGFNSVIIRNFSYFRNYENKHNHFFFLVFWVMIIGNVLSVLAYYVLKPFIIRQNIVNAPLFVENLDYLIPLIISTLVFFILDAYYTVLFKSVRGIILKELVQRVLLIIALYLYFLGLFNFEGFTLAYVISLALPGILMLVFIVVEGEWVIKPKWDFISRDMAKSMFSVGLFGILTSFVGSANLQIDRVMSSSMISLEITGIYSVLLYFATLIKIPSRALLKIASAFISEAWQRNDLKELSKIYKNTCKNQYMVALLVFIGLWANIENVFKILPANYMIGKYVILWLGISYTIEMASGASNNIIASSKHYKTLTWIVFSTLAVMIISNLIFIPLYHINGVAISTAITSVFYTLVRLGYIRYKFKLQPFNIKFVYITAIGVVAYITSIMLPTFNNFIIDIGVRSCTIAVVYCGLLFVAKISPEINSKIIETTQKYLKLKF